MEACLIRFYLLPDFTVRAFIFIARSIQYIAQQLVGLQSPANIYIYIGFVLCFPWGIVPLKSD